MGKKNKRIGAVAPPGGWPRPGREKQPPAPDVAESSKTVPKLDLDHPEVTRRRLVWRFQEVDVAGEWPPAEIGAAALGNLLEKMAQYESMTVGEIFKQGSQHGKRYEVPDLPSKALARLEEIKRDDEDHLYRLRCGAKPRLYGFLREHVFHVLWWDAEHTVYPAKLKHT